MSFPFQSSGISWASLNRSTATVGGWKELGRTTLASVNDNISVGSLADKRYYMLLAHTISSGATRHGLRMNSDTGNNYAWRISDNGAADSTVGSSGRIIMQGNNPATDEFSVGYCSNLSTKEKLMMSHTNKVASTGAGSPPNRSECVGKHAQTSNPIDNFTLFNSEAGDYASDSQFVILGWDKADTHTDNFWEPLVEKTLTGDSATIDTSTFTAKKYLWVQIISQQSTGGDPRWRVGNGTVDTGSNYAMRTSYNGGSDSTEGSQSLWNNTIQAATDIPTYVNAFFINIATKEKLGILEWVYQNTAGAGTAPTRREQVLKWVNTSNQMNRMELSLSSGNYRNGSKMYIWGAD